MARDGSVEFGMKDVCDERLTFIVVDAGTVGVVILVDDDCLLLSALAHEPTLKRGRSVWRKRDR